MSHDSRHGVIMDKTPLKDVETQSLRFEDVASPIELGRRPISSASNAKRQVHDDASIGGK